MLPRGQHQHLCNNAACTMCLVHLCCCSACAPTNDEAQKPCIESFPVLPLSCSARLSAWCNRRNILYPEQDRIPIGSAIYAMLLILGNAAVHFGMHQLSPIYKYPHTMSRIMQAKVASQCLAVLEQHQSRLPWILRRACQWRYHWCTSLATQHPVITQSCIKLW